MSSGLNSAHDTLESLKRSLTLAFEAPLKHTSNWTDDVATAHMVKAVRERHDGPGKPPDSQTLSMAVARYRRTGEPEGWRGLKRVCYGAALLDQKGWSIVGDEQLLEDLLVRAQTQDAPRKRMKCYQALLSSYFSFRLFQAEASAKAGWEKLREWLDARLRYIVKDSGRIPGWLNTLTEHKNLLRDGACDRYGPGLLAGDAKEFNAALSGIGIPSDSWVPEEAILAQIRAATSLGHEKFKEMLPAVLSVVSGKAGMEPPKSLRMRCIGMLVSRYARIPSKPEHILLRDAAVAHIGNPWLKKSVWDTFVLDERGNPDDAAREMVYGWLKRRLITDFFELMSADGSGDTRRLNYWLRFEPFVEDMWFALGSGARFNNSEGFRDFRTRAAGRLLNLEGTTYDNNAFVMRMGDNLAVEFGEAGNAFYLFKMSQLPPALSQKLLSGRERVDLTIHQLKNRDYAHGWKSHTDSPVSMVSWEQKFDEVVCPLIGAKPKQRPAFVPDLEVVLKAHGVDGQDLRDKGGALWVLGDNTQAAFNKKMTNLGFTYKGGKGWWRT